jgi:eukaryotic-like serine/threonine-protein kinase
VNEARKNAGEAADGRLWSFGPVEFDERSYELRVQGEPVELERKSLEVLRQLLYRAGEVVTKDELLEAVWPGRVLSDNSLPKAISRIREALGDDEQQLIRTVHGYGYRLVAPVKVQSARAAPALTRLDLHEGDHPPLRPLWSLVRRLGGGGQGEVWLARHDKTREERVFKFALDLAGLTAIKREITLYRFLRETLAGRDEFTRVLDWNLEEAPYYIELEHGGGNLEAWAESAGGLARVALPTRLELVARVADALAAAHSVGVLHKDLKPTNILVLPAEGEVPAIKLADFGSGGVLDPQRLEALGITRLGFTESILDGEAATAMYLAPEVMAGQPATVQADIYSLGIVLYQVAIGDLKQPLATGWERRVGDELLCEDIALAVAGDPALRLADAGALAQRLRSQDDRRRQRAAERAEKQRLEQERNAARERARRAELALERMHARRQWMLTLVSVLIVGVSASLGLYLDARRARNEAAAAAAASQAVADFLSKDMFAAVGGRPVQNLTVKELLDAATASLDQRGDAMPQAAAQVHLALGDAFWTLSSVRQAEQQLDQALERYERLGNLAGAAQAAARLVKVQMSLGNLATALPRYRGLHDRARGTLGARHPATLALAAELAFAQFATGEWLASAEAYRALVAEARSARDVDGALLATAEERLVTSLVWIGRYREAATAARAFASRMDRSSEAESLTAGNAHAALGLALTELEEFAQAEEELQRAWRLIQPWAPDESSGQLLAVKQVRAELQLRRQRHAEAIAIARQIVETIRAWPWNPQRLDLSPASLITLARAHCGAGQPAEAVAAAERAVASGDLVLGGNHPLTQYARVIRADSLRMAGRAAEAREALAAVDRRVLDGIGPDHPYTAELLRAEGLLARAEGRDADGRRALTEALRIFELRYGPRHSFAQRVRSELAAAT